MFLNNIKVEFKKNIKENTHYSSFKNFNNIDDNLSSIKFPQNSCVSDPSLGFHDNLSEIKQILSKNQSFYFIFFE